MSQIFNTFQERSRRLSLQLLATAVILSPSLSMSAGFSDEMDSFNSDIWHAADGWTNGYWTDNGWRADHASFADGHLIITLDDQPCATDPALCSGEPLASTEVRTNQFYGYGTMEARLKAAKGPGLVTAFFKYTGPGDGNPADEIDFEFLGDDTTRVMLNYFKDGIGGHETYIDLDFDAAEEFHTYTINHQPGRIEWLIDGNLVHAVTGDDLPTHAGRVMVSLWAVADGTELENWAGVRDNSILPKQAEFDYVNVTESSATFSDPFDSFNFDDWIVSSGWHIPYWTDSFKVAEMTSINNSNLVMEISPEPCTLSPITCQNKALAAGGASSTHFYGFGYTEATFKAAKGDGIVSAFFRYTGPADGNKQQELDFEFLGDDTTRVHLNYFIDGVGGHEKFIDLGYDASEEFHTYAFRQSANQVEWLIDGQVVHSAVDNFPNTPTRIHFSIWGAAHGTDLENWAGTWDLSQLPTAAYVADVSFSNDVTGSPDPEPADPAPIDPDPITPDPVEPDPTPEPAPQTDGYRVVSNHSGLLLTVLSASTDSGTYLVQWPEETWRSDGEHQYFSFEEVDGDYIIHPQHSDLCLDSTGNHGNDVVQRNCNGSDAQRWYFTNASNGYNLISRATGQCATVFDDRLIMGTWIMGEACDNRSSQSFSPEGFTPEVATTTPPEPTEPDPETPDPATPTNPTTFSVVSNLSQLPLTILLGSLEPGTQLVQWPIETWRVNGDHQRLRFEPVDEDYVIRPEHSNLCLDASGNYGNDIVQNACNGGASQRWSVVNTENGFNLISRDTEQCATVYDDRLTMGNWIMGEPCVGKSGQSFTIDGFTDTSGNPDPTTPIVDSASPHQIMATHSELFMSFVSASTADGAQLVQWPDAAGAVLSSHQEFTFEHNNGYYLIKPLHSGKCLDSSGNYGNDIVQRTCSDADSQRWYLTQAGNDFKIVSRASNQCATVYENSTTLGSWLFVQPCDADSAQTFRIIGFNP